MQLSGLHLPNLGIAAGLQLDAVVHHRRRRRAANSRHTRQTANTAHGRAPELAGRQCTHHEQLGGTSAGGRRRQSRQTQAEHHVQPLGWQGPQRTSSLKRWYTTSAAGERPSCPSAASVPSLASTTAFPQGTGSSWYPGVPRRRGNAATSFSAMMRAASARLAGALPACALLAHASAGALPASALAALSHGGALPGWTLATSAIGRLPTQRCRSAGQQTVSAAASRLKGALGSFAKFPVVVPQLYAYTKHSHSCSASLNSGGSTVECWVTSAS